jgi:hypothetical protein
MHNGQGARGTGRGIMRTLGTEARQQKEPESRVLLPREEATTHTHGWLHQAAFIVGETETGNFMVFQALFDM